jgi:Asp-tRNA(Asn)/Glu-tRNA(Gln) amidotransferase B subunit
MRDKEKKQDYRFMPEPNLPPLRISQTLVDRLAQEMPELPQHTRARLMVSSFLSTFLPSSFTRHWWIDLPCRCLSSRDTPLPNDGKLTAS